MRVLIVCSKNSGKIAPFIQEQAESLVRIGLDVDYFTIEGKGLKGYLKNRKRLMDKIRLFQPQLIHAHYGLSGLLANLQRQVPVVTTYHGSDINHPKVYPLSRLNMTLSAYNIFVSQKNVDKAGLKKGSALIPCGVDIHFFSPMDKQEARKQLNLMPDKRYVLFAGSFSNKVKNSGLAKEAVKQLEGVKLLELKGYTRQQVAQLMNAVDAVLMTSFTEGSPQFIKEAMACNCPVVSVPVGDVPEVIEGVEGCYLTTYDASDVAAKLQQALAFGQHTEGRPVIIKRGLDAEKVAAQIRDIYQSLITTNH